MPRKPFTGTVTDEFGPRIHPISGLPSFHYGMDGVGDGNFAPADGTLIGYGDAGGYGNRAIFVDKFGWTHWLAHNDNDATLVPVGTWLAEGARVAWMGTTGSSTGVHCHWETRRPTGEVVDPRIWLSETARVTPSGGDAELLEDELSAEDVNRILDAIRRESRYRLYKRAGDGLLVAINWALPTGDPAKIAWPKTDKQADSLRLNYQIIGDTPQNARVLPDEAFATLIRIARGSDQITVTPAEFA